MVSVTLLLNNHGRAVRYCAPLNFSELRTAPLCRHSHIGFDKVLCLRRFTFSGPWTAPRCRRGPRGATPLAFQHHGQRHGAKGGELKELVKPV